MCYGEGKKYKIKFLKDGEKVLTGKYASGLYYLEGIVLNCESH